MLILIENEVTFLWKNILSITIHIPFFFLLNVFCFLSAELFSFVLFATIVKFWLYLLYFHSWSPTISLFLFEISPHTIWGLLSEQQRLAELKTEEREVTARLTWKILEEPVLVNGTAPSSEQPEQLQWPHPQHRCWRNPKRTSPGWRGAVIRGWAAGTQSHWGAARVRGRGAVTSPEEQEPKADFYSSDLYNSGLCTASPTTVAWPQGNTVRNHFLLLYII